MDSEKGVTVELYIYDLTNGLASLLSPAILGEEALIISKSDSRLANGRQIDGVWHTAVVAYEREFFYGGGGITSCAPGGTQLGTPHQVERLGETFVPFQVFVDYIQGLATSTYTPSAYRLLEHNCNHFSDEVAQFLCGAHVPKHIVQQPERALPPPLRLAVQALLDNLLPDAGQAVYASGVRSSRQQSPSFTTLNNQIEEARVQSAELEARRCSLSEKLARKERRRDKRRRKHPARDLPDPAHPAGDAPEVAAAETVAAEAAEAAEACAGPSSASLAREAAERREDEQRKRARDPPILYSDIDGAAEFDKLAAQLEGMELSAEERQSLDELQQYLVQGEGSWVLGDDFLAFIGRLLSEECSTEAVRAATLRCLSACALRDDVSLLLHQDRRHHALLNYATTIDRRALPEQLALALFMCNLFENISSSEWLLYISEWDCNGQPLSNIRVTTKVCVHALLSEQLELREYGTALLYNIAAKEVKTVVFDEVCVELAMAALQLLAWAPAEEHLYRATRALARLAAHSADVPQLVAVVGPDPAAFRGTSPRVDEQIDLIMKKLK